MSDKKIDIFDDDYEIARRVKSVFGIPNVLLEDEDIISPEYKIRAEKYIKRKLSTIYNDIKEIEKGNIQIAYIYYLAYLICPSMQIRLPQKMKNISTETDMQTINWYTLGQEMLNRCDEIIDDLIDEYSEEETTLGNTIVELSDTVSYPNELT